MATAPKFNDWGDMANYTASQLALTSQNKAPQFTAATLGPVTQAGNVGIGNVAPVTAQGVLSDQRQFMDPYLGAVVGTTLTNYDQQARQQLAQMQAQAARNGAFSGSRYGIREGQTIADAMLGRATLEAQLRSNGFNSSLGNALQLGGQNQGAELQRQIAQGNISAQIAMANAQAANQAAQQQAMLEQQAGLTNAQLQADQQSRNLQALALLGNTAGQVQQGVQSDNAGDRADLALIADIGAQQQALDQQAAQAPVAQLANAGNMMGAINTGAYTGETVDATSDGTATQSGGLLGGILGGLSLVPVVGDAVKGVGKIF